MKNPEIVVRPAGHPMRNTIMVHNRHMPTWQGTLAYDLVRSAGMGAAEPIPGKEHEMRLLTPAEVVKRACELAEATYAAIEERGWMLDYPSFDEVEATETDGGHKPGF